MVKRPVLIIGSIPRIVTVVARSLHRHGITVNVADSKLQPRPRSRSIREFVRLPDAESERPGFLNALRNFIQLHQHDMLIPTEDYALAAMAEHYDELKDLLHLACPPPDAVHRVLDKALTLEAAQNAGVAVPKTFVVSNSAHLPELIGKIGLPAVLKPSQKRATAEDFKSWIIQTADQVNRRFPNDFAFTPPMLLQEYCQGAGVGIEVLLHQGECHALFQHRRLKEWPYRGGYAVTAVAESLDQSLVQSSLALLRALQWEGVAMVEFRVNPENGRAVLMEVNGRYWGSIALPVMAGIDFPLFHWKLTHGEPINVPSTYSVGTRWRWTAGYIRRFHELAIAAKRSPDARKILRHDLSRALADLSCSHRDSLLTLSDPLPATFELLNTFEDLVADDFRALFKRLGT
jgi:predicted ATP-grasp superfamily ATP-dependent carboligase